MTWIGSAPHPTQFGWREKLHLLYESASDGGLGGWGSGLGLGVRSCNAIYYIWQKNIRLPQYSAELTFRLSKLKSKLSSLYGTARPDPQPDPQPLWCPPYGSLNSSPNASQGLARSWENGPVRPFSQDKLPHVRRRSLRIDLTPGSLVLCGPVK